MGYNATTKLHLAANGDAFFGTDVNTVSIAAGGLVVGTTGSIMGGQTDYNTGTGFFLGYSGSYYKVSVGNSAGNKLLFDGSDGSLTITGAITAASGAIGGWSIAATTLTSTGVAIRSGATANIAFGATPPTGSGTGTGIFLDATGLYGLLANVPQVTLNAATGALTAGAGGVTLNATGIVITPATTYDTTHAYRFASSDGDFGVFGRESATIRGMQINVCGPSGKGGILTLYTTTPDNTHAATIELTAIENYTPYRTSYIHVLPYQFDVVLDDGGGLGGVTQLVVASNGVAAAKFSCNGKGPQSAYASGGAVVPGAGAYGFDSAVHAAAVATLLTNIRTALVNNGIMS